MMDETAIEASLAAHIDGFQGPISVQKTAIGQSNPTYIITAVSGKYVLRSKPLGALLKSAHAVDREYRVLSALFAQGLPVPRTRYLCTDDSVLGAMFYVMDFVEGRNFMDPTLPRVDAQARAAMYASMGDALVAVHSVDLDAAGLRDYGPPGNYFERQFARWSGQFQQSAVAPMPEMDALIAQIDARMPADDGWVTLVHGDWRIDNLLFENNAVSAILDWELSTLGHPLADLGAQLMQWELPVGEVGRGLQGVDRRALGIPENAAYIADYARKMGLNAAPDMQFYTAFAFFRMAAILEGVKRRALDGNASNPEKALKLGEYAVLFARMGLRRINAES